MKTVADEHGGGDAGQQGWIRRRRRCRTATEEIWDDGDDKMGWKDDDGLGQISTRNDYQYASGYGGRGDVGRQQMGYGKTEMAKWVGRTATEWANIDREQLPK